MTLPLTPHTYQPEQAARMRRCRAIYPGAATLRGQDIRCDDYAGHTGQHGHTFAARYWDDPTASDESAVWTDGAERIAR